MDDERSCADDYVAAGYGSAYVILQAGCEIPPSLEVFRQELKDESRRGRFVRADELARRLARDYRRVNP